MIQMIHITVIILLIGLSGLECNDLPYQEEVNGYIDHHTPDPLDHHSHPVPSTDESTAMDPIFSFFPYNQFIILCAVIGGAVLILIILCCCLFCRGSKTTYSDLTREEIAAGITPDMVDKGVPIIHSRQQQSPVFPILIPPSNLMMMPFGYPGYPPGAPSEPRVNLPPGVVLPKALRGVRPKNAPL